MKKILDEIRKDIEIIDQDERYHYEPALIDVNAPLALIQVDMKAKMFVLRKYEKMIEGSICKEGLEEIRSGNTPHKSWKDFKDSMKKS